MKFSRKGEDAIKTSEHSEHYHNMIHRCDFQIVTSVEILDNQVIVNVVVPQQFYLLSYLSSIKAKRSSRNFYRVLSQINF